VFINLYGFTQVKEPYRQLSAFQFASTNNKKEKKYCNERFWYASCRNTNYHTGYLLWSVSWSIDWLYIGCLIRRRMTKIAWKFQWKKADKYSIRQAADEHITTPTYVVACTLWHGKLTIHNYVVSYRLSTVQTILLFRLFVMGISNCFHYLSLAILDTVAI
jgi:hypothetical protein